MIKLKIIVAGSKDVGKTTLIRRFISGKFESNLLNTIGVDFMTKTLTIGDNEVHLSIWDFAGEQKFRVLFPSYCSGASGALILYDTTNAKSFDELEEWSELIDNATGKISKILLGTKVDLVEERKVDKTNATTFCEAHADHYIECSSKTGENVEDLFMKLAKDILEKSLKNCPHCAELVPKELIFCQYCGKKM